MLFQRFDRLLFLAKGGRTVYFGPVGDNSHILTSYFERNGAFPCPSDANPAEWMLDVIGAAPGSHSDIDWHETWNGSEERVEVRRELAEMKSGLPQVTQVAGDPNDKAAFREFAAPFGFQVWEVQKRVFAQYWRTPSYIYSKLLLCTLSALFIGFSFYNEGTSQQSLQNQLFAIFSLFTIFGQLVQQILPHFVTQRALYEARERPSKTYSWKAFMISNLVVELPWNALAGLIVFFCWYYPIGTLILVSSKPLHMLTSHPGLYKNAIPAGQVHERGGLMFLLVEEFLLFTSTFSTMIIAAIDTAETAGNIGNLLFSLTLIFCGVLAAPGAFPTFVRHHTPGCCCCRHWEVSLTVNELVDFHVPRLPLHLLHRRPPVRRPRKHRRRVRRKRISRLLSTVRPDLRHLHVLLDQFLRRLHSRPQRNRHV